MSRASARGAGAGSRAPGLCAQVARALCTAVGGGQDSEPGALSWGMEGALCVGDPGREGSRLASPPCALPPRPWRSQEAGR